MKSIAHGAMLLDLFASLTLGGCAPEQQSHNPYPTSEDSPEDRELQCVGSDPSLSQDMVLPVGDYDSTRSIFWTPHGSSPRGGIVFVSGVDGGFIEPGDEIYRRIAQELSHRGIASIFVQYRTPGEIEASLEDALQAARHLRALGVKKMALVGWSFGGAVITHAAVRIPEALTIVGFAPQAKDTEPVQRFTTQSILLIHSRDDENVPFISSQQILDEAPMQIRKRLIELESFNHLLTGAGSRVEPIVLNWLKDEFGLTR
jgi:alpha/beta superfamily hydrolase